MNALEKDLASVQYNTSQAEFDENDDGTYNEVPGYNFRDQPSSFLSRLQNPQFLDNPRTTGIGTLKNWASNKLGTGFNWSKAALSGIGNMIMPGLGWALGAINPGKLRGMNYAQNRYNTQAEYEANRAARQQQSRVKNMMDRRAAGKGFSQANLNEQTMGSKPGYYGNVWGGKGKGTTGGQQISGAPANLGQSVHGEGSGGNKGNGGQGNGNKGSSEGAPGTGMHRARGGRIGYFFGGRAKFKNGGLAGIL
jgi:hypothetical protein|tara:strand:+ start:285 stop:1037 length:753 start_codon:yes stop_codon:yes gene_type:complete